MQRLLSLGDSYTIGEGVTAKENWPSQLASMLRESGVSAEDPRIIARTGWTTAELADAIAEASPDPDWDVVTLLIGVNDQYRGYPLATFAAGHQSLVQTAMRLARKDSGRVIVISIPDWGVTPFAAGRDRAVIAAEIDAYNEIAQSHAESAGALWVDVTEMSRRLFLDPAHLVEDGLHPGAGIYRRWAELISRGVG